MQQLTWPLAYGQEDCLHLHIWRKHSVKIEDEGPKPVVIWLYGGAWVIGSSDSDFYNLKELVAKGDVIGVGVNYRVGPLGFLSLGSNSTIGGNFGLYDQEAGIRWV